MVFNQPHPTHPRACLPVAWLLLLAGLGAVVRVTPPLTHRYDQILAAVVDQIRICSRSSNGDMKDEGEAEEDATAAAAAAAALHEQTPTQQVWWAFNQLLQERYIERAPPANLPPLPPASLAPSKPKKAATKPGAWAAGEGEEEP